jgi:hypothetical protein
MPAPDAIIKLLPECEQFSTILRVSNFAQPSLWQRASLALKIRLFDIGAAIGALHQLPIVRLFCGGGEFREAGNSRDRPLVAGNALAAFGE